MRKFCGCVLYLIKEDMNANSAVSDCIDKYDAHTSELVAVILSHTNRKYFISIWEISTTN